MTANVDAMVRAGVDAYRAGNKVEARTLLERAIELDGYNESAWLWLSAVVETKEEQQTCLENVLIINPENERAQQGLKSLGIDPMTVVAPAEDATSAVDDTFEDISFDDASFGSEDTFDSAPAFSDTGSSPFGDEEEDLFGDIDFGADDGAFSLDDAVFDSALPEEDEIYDEEDFGEFLDEGDTYAEDDLYGDAFDDGDELYADLGTMEEFDDVLGDSDYDADAFNDDPFAPPPAVDDNAMSRSEYFAMIPDDIQEQRLPGTDEKVSSVHYVLMGVLGLVNLGALAFVALQFIG